MGLRIAIFGQAAFGRDVLAHLAGAGHEIVGVHVPPDRGRPDPLAEEAARRRLRLFRHARYRRRGEAVPELLAEYRTLGAELNVLPYTTVILPVEIVRPRASARSASILLFCRATGAAARSPGRSSSGSARPA